MSEETAGAPRRCQASLTAHMNSIGAVLSNAGVDIRCVTNYEALVELTESLRLLGGFEVYTPVVAAGAVAEYNLIKSAMSRQPKGE